MAAGKGNWTALREADNHHLGQFRAATDLLKRTVNMTCNFCGNDAGTDRAFSNAEDSGGKSVCICHNCVRDLYIALIAQEMRPPRPISSSPKSPTSAGRAQVIHLRPRKDQ